MAPPWAPVLAVSAASGHPIPDQPAAIVPELEHRARGAGCLGNQEEEVSGGEGATHCQVGQGCHDLGAKTGVLGACSLSWTQAQYQGRKKWQMLEVGRQGVRV